ncbi:MAG: MFS transporter [Myxococcales bacterium]|nr:MFS transporter [Myxococcales bacterium]
MSLPEPASPEPGAPAEALGSPAERQGTYAEVGEKLPMSIKLAYGMPNLAGAGMALPIVIYMTIFYSDVVLLPLGYIALAVAFARAFDAITDPVMGWISDRTNTRWGRRRPWMLLGAPLCAAAFYFLFTPPAELTGSAAAPWFVVFFSAYFLFHTVYSIPHYGLGPELTADYQERSSLFAVMEGAAVLGTICGTLLPFFFFRLFGGQRAGFWAFSLTIGAVLILLYVWQCYRIRERPDYYTRKANPLVPGVRRVFRNRPARLLLATYLVGSITGAIPGLMMPYFTKYVLMVDDPDKWLAILLLTYFGFGFATLPLWLWFVRRFGKYPAYIISALMGVTASLMLFFQGEGDVLPTFLILIWAGSAFGVRLFLGPSIQADVIDYDELYSGKRRESQYGALWSVIIKFVVIPSAAVPLAIMAQLGYEPNVEQSETMKFTIRAIYSFGPASFGLVSLLVFLYFPIREQNHRQILDGIEKHKRGESAIDPLTGKLLPPPDDRGVDEDTGWFLDHFSRRELRRLERRGSAGLRWTTALWTLGCLALASLSFWLVFQGLGDLSARPGLFTTVEVAIGGFATTGALYHLVRLWAALRLARSPVPVGTVRAHLEVLDSLVYAPPAGGGR